MSTSAPFLTTTGSAAGVGTSHVRPTDAELAERFRPVLAEIERGAVDREVSRDLPYQAVADLAGVGFTALTVPVEHGGSGRDVTELVDWLIELGAADSNLPQLLRAHFAVVERLVTETDYPRRTEWLRRAARGEIFGNASHERSRASVGTYGTRLTSRDGHLELTGTKYYSTGSLFADWIAVVAHDDAERVVHVIVDARAPGVERVDDWDGFGQRLTGSGTTHFTAVTVDQSDVVVRGEDGPSYVTPFVQLVLLAALAGTARGVEADAAAFVRNRTRVYSQGIGDRAADDPLVQQVVGRLGATSFVVSSAVRSAGQAVQAARDATVGARAGAADLKAPLDAIEVAELAVVHAQIGIIPLVLDAAGELFEVGGASATSESRRLDRHWRNARTLASHNPAIYQARAVGAQSLTGTGLVYGWATGEGRTPSTSTHDKATS